MTRYPRLSAIAVVAMAAATLSACVAGGEQAAGPQAMSPRELAALEANLGGKVAGEPVRCIRNDQGVNTVRVSDDILLYRVSSRLVYRNDLRGHCPGLGRDSDIIVTQSLGGMGPCSGDIIRLVDRTSGISGPSCVLGEFTPYRTRSAD